MLNFSRIEGVMARFVTIFKAIPVSTLQFVIIAAILAWLFLQLGRAVWWFAPEPVVTPMSAVSKAVTSKNVATSEQTVNLSQLQSWDWFGKTDKKALSQAPKVEPKTPAVDESSAVKTRLRLTLRGVVATENQDLAHAVIESGSKQHDYKVGDKIKINGNVKLAKVLRDHVILDNRGRLESLYLYVEDPKSKSQVGTKQISKSAVKPESNVVDHRNDPNITRIASQYRRQLLENPTSLADVIRVSPNQGPSGTLNGYRIRPGLHRKQFSQLGFKSGDVVTGINGIDLSNPTKALEVYQMMREASEASFSVKRGGEELTFIVDLSE